MKRLVILTAVLTVMAGVGGCRCCDWLFRGAPAGGCAVPAYAPPCAAPCAPACDPCSPCGAPGAVAPGPEAYAPGPMP